MTICAAVISVVCAVAGIIISVLAETPTGSTIVAVDIAAFAVMAAVGRVVRRRGRG